MAPLAGAPWRLLRTWDAPAGFNMALDEALLAGDDPRPVLRLYSWEPAAVSLGYFQRHREVLEYLERAGAAVPPLVRRLTGGGAIHHRDELTFSIAAPADHPLYRGPVRESYRRVHGALAQALAGRGVRAVERGATTLASDDPGSLMCFHRSSALDLAWNERKGVGSAQRRRDGRVLHHGSIKLETTELEGDVAFVGGVDCQAFGAELVEVLSQAWGVAFEPEAPREEELLAARRRESFFSSPGFLGRR